VGSGIAGVVRRRGSPLPPVGVIPGNENKGLCLLGKLAFNQAMVLVSACAHMSPVCFIAMSILDIQTFRFRLDRKKKFFTLRVVKPCPIPGNIPGQAGQGSERPDPVEDAPVHGQGFGLDGL